MLKARRNFFNLIEIAMALGIIGFGVASVMSVFPAALQNANNSISENYASNVADIFYAYINQALKSDPGSYYTTPASFTGKKHDYFDSLILGAVSETAKPAAIADSATLAQTITAENIGADSQSKKDNGDESNPVTKNIFPGASGVFKVTQGDPTDPDFSSVLRVWRNVITDVKMKVVKTDGTYADISTTKIDDGSNPPGEAMAGIYIEVSWPSHKPYGKRDKRLYYKEIYDIYD